MMKNIIEKFQICLVLSALLFSSFVAACSGNDDTVTPEITIPANILTDGMTFSKTGGTSTLNIKSNVALEVTSSAPEWCKVTAESSASSSILKYTVMAEAKNAQLVADGTPIARATVDVHFDVHLLGFNAIRVNQITDAGGVVHRAASQAVVFELRF